jgi:restriction endonuclease S subunit
MIKLKRDKWRTVPLGEICKLEYGNNLTDKMRNGGSVPVYGSAGIVGWHDKPLTKSPTLIVGRKGSVGNVFYSEIPCFPIDTTYFVEETVCKENLRWLELFLSNFNLRQLNMATAVPGLNRNIAHLIQIPLPPLEEQKQIAALFQSIETAMEQVDGQEKNLKALWLQLVDEFVSEKPSFGDLLKGKKLQTVNYCDVTEKIMRRIEPVSYGIEKIVGGEHLNAEDFKIRTWDTVGKDPLGPAFHVLFQPGDILYGSRRTYLKKVAFTEFEGVCANTTYVIRANEKILLQNLLKHIMLSQPFTQFSIGVSKGSTNPYINWKDLDNFSFQIPDLEAQREMVKVLDGILEIREQLKQQKTTLKNLKQKLLNEILG